MTQSSELYRAVVDSAPMAAGVLGPDLTILAWNAAAADLTGWAAEEVVGKRDPTVAPEDVERVRQALATWLEHPEQVERLVLRRLRPDGSEMQLTLESATPIAVDAGRAMTLWFSETTDVDAMLLQRNRLSRHLVGATHIEQVLPVLTAATRDVLGGTAAIVLRRCPPGEHLHGVRAFGMETEVAEQVQLDLDRGAPWDVAVAGGVADGTLVLDGREHPVTFAPMGPEGEAWVLAVCDTAAASASPHVRDLFRAVGDEAWAALERVALVTELDGKIEILEATNRIASSVGLDLEHALDAVTRQAAEALSCERAAVYLTDPVTGGISLAHVFASDASPAQLLAEDEGLALAEEVVRTGKEVLFQDVTACEFADGPWHADAGSVAVMGLPLQVGNRIVGTLVVAHTVAHPRGFTSLCQQVGAAVSQQAALAVEHARLFEVELDNVQRLQDLDRMKADWMAGVTHDLKAPLTGLFGFVETLRRMTGHVSEDQQREFLNVMSRQADQLVDLVEDLLLSARVDADVVARRRDLIPVDELVDDAVDSLSPDERARVEVRGHGVSVPVRGDPAHLQRVFQNLLGNALRHGGGTVVVTVADDDGNALVAFEDDGPGVPEQQRERIFERFVHGEHGASSGLGLYVARGIVDAHDGSIEVTDRRDGHPGARFEVRFPRGRAGREQELDGPAPDEERPRASPDTGI